MKKPFFIFIALFSLVVNSYSVEDKVIAIVNNEVITQAELNSYIGLLRLQIGEEGWKRFDLSEEKILDGLIEDILLVQEAKRNKIEIPERQIESKINEMKKQFRNSEDFSLYLAQQGLSLADLKERLKEKMLNERLITIEIRSRLYNSPSEVTAYYKGHMDELKMPESVKVESIFVKELNSAKEIYIKLKQGADFAHLQNQYPEKSNAKTVSRGQLRKDLEDVIFNLPVGGFCEPQKISDGYYIFLVREKIPASTKDLSEMQDEISNILLNNKYRERLEAFIEKLKKSSYIVIKK